MSLLYEQINRLLLFKVFKLSMGTRVKNAEEFEGDNSTFTQKESPSSFTASRLNVNDLLKRKENLEKSERRTNIYILSGVVSLVLVIVLILNL